jgi:hypothetical protein
MGNWWVMHGLHRIRGENGVVVVCERINGGCELRSSLKHDELKDMGCFVPMKKEVY